MDRRPVMSFRVRWTLLVLAGALVAVGQSPLRATIDGTALLRQVDRRLNPPSYDA